MVLALMTSSSTKQKGAMSTAAQIGHFPVSETLGSVEICAAYRRAVQ
jgi:hypothetical protein